jgi:hypothetical protein
MRTDNRIPALAGLALWVLAGLVLAGLHTTLARHGETWWYETVGAGVLVGLLGLAMVWRRR